MSKNALASGTILDRSLEVKRVLGEGGFGITYLVYDHDLQQDLVLKEFFPPAWCARIEGDVVPFDNDDSKRDYEHFLKRFLEEARAAARVDHPNLVKVYRFFSANGTGYFAMAWHEGETLADQLKRQGTIGATQSVEFIDKLLDGLQRLHDVGLIHRDIKPGNIYVRKSGEPLLLDFGSARTPASSSGPLTAVLSPGYAPFEQYTLNGIQGPHTDIYAVGAVLYKMLTGLEPLDALTRRDINHRFTTCSEAAPPAVPRSLCHVVDHAMEMEFAQRIPDAIILRQDLRASLQHTEPLNNAQTELSISSREPTSRARAPKLQRFVLAGVAGLVMTVGMLWMTRLANSEDRCNILAASPDDPERPNSVEGVALGDIDIKSAVAACKAAAEGSETSRVWFQYGRVLDASGDFTEAIYWYEKAAEMGHAAAQNNLAMHYASGNAAVIADQSKAFLWYGKAAEQGLAIAQYNLARMYGTGQGVAPDQGKALAWMEFAADRGLAQAQWELAAAYESGVAVAKDEAKAFALFEKAAMSGMPAAQSAVAECYLAGRGTQLDVTKGIEWLRKSADQGYSHAQHLLGWSYQHGRGVEKDGALAIHWYVQGAKSGYPPSQYTLGTAYQLGALGLNKDPDQALHWLSKASEQGYMDSAKLVNELLQLQ